MDRGLTWLNPPPDKPTTNPQATRNRTTRLIVRRVDRAVRGRLVRSASSERTAGGGWEDTGRDMVQTGGEVASSRESPSFNSSQIRTRRGSSTGRRPAPDCALCACRGRGGQKERKRSSAGDGRWACQNQGSRQGRRPPPEAKPAGRQTQRGPRLVRQSGPRHDANRQQNVRHRTRRRAQHIRNMGLQGRGKRKKDRRSRRRRTQNSSRHERRRGGWSKDEQVRGRLGGGRGEGNEGKGECSGGRLALALSPLSAGSRLRRVLTLRRRNCSRYEHALDRTALAREDDEKERETFMNRES